MQFIRAVQSSDLPSFCSVVDIVVATAYLVIRVTGEVVPRSEHVQETPDSLATSFEHPAGASIVIQVIPVLKLD